MAPEDEPPPAPCSRSPSAEDIFQVELERGPSGLGMGLTDGMVSGRRLRGTREGPGLRGAGAATARPRPGAEASAPQHTRLGAPGLYIQTLLPGSPAAADGRLALGDRILEVNGSSLAGVSYLRYRGEPPGGAGRAPQEAPSAPSAPFQGRGPDPPRRQEDAVPGRQVRRRHGPEDPLPLAAPLGRPAAHFI